MVLVLRALQFDNSSTDTVANCGKGSNDLPSSRHSYLHDPDDLDPGLLVGKSQSYGPTEILEVPRVDSGMTNGDAGHNIYGHCHSCRWSELKSGYLKFHYEGSHRPTLIPFPPGHLELRASLASHGGNYSSTQPTAQLIHEKE